MAHLSELQLQEALEAAKKQVKIGALYCHYKHADQLYKVTEVAILEASDEVCVMYRAQYGKKISFVRPLSSWLSIVRVDGAQVPRFTLIS